MIKRVVVTTGLKARGYVDGRYVGEEKKDNGGRDDPRDRKRRGKPGPAAKGRGKKRGGVAAGGDNFGNTTGTAGKRGRRGKGRTGAQEAGGSILPGNRVDAGAGGGRGLPKSRKNRSGKKTPFRQPLVSTANSLSPSEVTDLRRVGEEARQRRTSAHGRWVGGYPRLRDLARDHGVERSAAYHDERGHPGRQGVGPDDALTDHSKLTSTSTSMSTSISGSDHR